MSIIRGVLVEDSLEYLVAVEPGPESGAEEEGSGELTVERVALLGGRSESVVQEDGDQPPYPQGRLLATKVEDSVVFERLSEDEGGLVVGTEQLLTVCVCG